MYKLGLLGKNISYSFSKSYFEKKFKREHIENVSYDNFDIEDISQFPSIIMNTPGIKGMNVTIPYKEAVIPYLHKINKKAQKIGAINTIRITKKAKLVGYNTDWYGFKKSIKPHLKPRHRKALILGTGGASKAVAYTLNKLKIKYRYVSRSSVKGINFTYDMLTEEIIKDHPIIINCSPVGTFPNIDACPDIPYNGITEHHILFDLIYNPEETKFLKLGKQQQATTINGLKMLEYQAEKSWSIWNLRK